MDKITEKLVEEMSPFIILAGYRSNYEYYFESHDINDNGQVLSGKPLAAETIENILNSFKSQKISAQPKGLVPSNMVYMDLDNEIFIWKCPGKKRMLYFRDEFVGNGEAFVPDMIFKVKGKALSVFAVKDLKSENPILCVPPFPNCSNEGGVCQGSAKTKMKGNTFQDIINYWETIFWASEFTHLNANTVTKDNVTLTWKDLIKTGGKFPIDQLIEKKKKLNDLWK
ncbi:hypothetical protein SMI01S_11900 [Sphingobacterium mizutaii NBRC 14946 = DSM 11724]|uniref:PRTRC system protein B n=2 Tax=Sphingobacterium mizutaii TaxID=1010 RepID=A0AAJ4XEG2_9SPHI|nr:hypothetical protein [Sphingobacterium mizutaii]GEM67584.1 hypothetical protein SMI01S_11900 [Sphingobacterium mizutaii NBRC 14946 = DSM 11724]SDL14688.1 PRTRC system protein B [Sphingobacterium mizutaii]SNV52201.1 PRTRC system protein B [Sphingobacterium mizutaii]